MTSFEASATSAKSSLPPDAHPLLHERLASGSLTTVIKDQTVSQKYEASTSDPLDFRPDPSRPISNRLTASEIFAPASTLSLKPEQIRSAAAQVEPAALPLHALPRRRLECNGGVSLRR